MSTWRNWLRSLLPWTDKGVEEKPTLQSALSTESSVQSFPQKDEIKLPFGESRYVYAAPLKSWVVQQVSSYAWDRAVIRTLPLLQSRQLPIREMLSPSPLFQVPPEVVRTLLSALREMYGVEVPYQVLQEKPSVSQSSL